MVVESIRTIADAERFCAGVINDFESGIIDKEEAMKHLKDYTIYIHDMFERKVKRLNKN